MSAASPARPARSPFLAVWTALVLLATGWFYGWTATSAGSPLRPTLDQDDLYNRLADGFLTGHLGFAELPPPELAQLDDPYDPKQNAPYQRYHDVSYYQGRYYLYFGPIPALVLLVPWKAITGSHLPQSLAVAAFAWGSACLGCLLLRALRRQHFPDTPTWVSAGGTLLVCFGNLLPILLRRPIVYELAIASACFFGLFALWLLHRALGASAKWNAWLAAASLSLGLAIGCRPNFLFGAAGALGAFFWWAYRPAPGAGWRPPLRPMLAATLPLGAIGLALAAYNYARFGDAMELGTHYMLAGGSQTHLEMTSIRFIPVNLYYYFFARPQFSAFFPFFQVTRIPWFTLPDGYSGEEDMYGILVTLPVLWAGFALVRPGRAPAAGAELKKFAAILLAFAGLNAGFLLMLAGANNRYLVDFVPTLMLLAWAGVMAWEARPPSLGKYLGRAFWTASLAYGLLFNVFVSFQHNELLRFHNPTAYRRLAHAFDHVPQWLGETRASKVGPLRVRLKFPAGRTGSLEPLVVTGLSFRADFLWVYYVDPGHIKIGFEHTSYGGPVSAPLAVDLSAEHTLEVRMGSFYPPVESPFYDRMNPAQISRLKRTLRVLLDGREVLAGTYDFYDSSPGDVAVGHNPVSDAFGRKFTGAILQTERLGRVDLP